MITRADRQAFLAAVQLVLQGAAQDYTALANGLASREGADLRTIVITRNKATAARSALDLLPTVFARELGPAVPRVRKPKAA